jgi:hypothetical protein
MLYQPAGAVSRKKWIKRPFHQPPVIELTDVAGFSSAATKVSQPARLLGSLPPDSKKTFVKEAVWIK